jgi:hypothetical protein
VKWSASVCFNRTAHFLLAAQAQPFLGWLTERHERKPKNNVGVAGHISAAGRNATASHGVALDRFFGYQCSHPCGFLLAGHYGKGHAGAIGYPAESPLEISLR